MLYTYWYYKLKCIVFIIGRHFSSNTSTDTSLELIRVSGNVKRQFRRGFKKIKSTCSWKQLLKSLLLTRGGTLIEYFKYIGHSEDFWFIVNYPLMGVLYENWQDNVEFKLSSNTSTESIDKSWLFDVSILDLILGKKKISIPKSSVVTRRLRRYGRATFVCLSEIRQTFKIRPQLFKRWIALSAG